METDLPVMLKGDPLRLGQILLNLANNAIKFTAKGEIEISISGVEILDDEAMLKFDIRDTGIGLSQEQQAANCFKPFTRQIPPPQDVTAVQAWAFPSAKNSVK